MSNSIPKSYRDYLVDLLFEYLRNMTSKDIQNGIRFVNSENDTDLSKLENALRSEMPSMLKTAIGKGTTDETAKDQYDLYKKLHPDTDLKWYNFKKDDEKKLPLYKPEPLSKTDERERLSKGLRSHAEGARDNLKKKLRKSINRTARKLPEGFKPILSAKEPFDAGMKAAALTATLSSIALNDVGLDGPIQAGGVAIASGVGEQFENV